MKKVVKFVIPLFLSMLIVFSLLYAKSYKHVDGWKNKPLALIGIQINDAVELDSTDIIGTAAFTGTETLDTVVNSNFLSTDFFFLSQRSGSPDAQDILTYTAVAGTLFTYRLASGASGLNYNWLRIVGR